MIYLSVLLAAFFTGSTVYAQDNIDSLFTMEGYRRNVCLQGILGRLANKPAELIKLQALVQVKGSDPEKCQVDLARELATVAETDYQKNIMITRKYLAIARKLQNHFLQAWCYHTISENYSLSDLHNKSFEYKLYCLDELEKDPEGNFFEQSWMLHQAAAEYYRFSDYPKAVALCKVAFALQGKNSPNGHWFMKVVSNLAGMSYLKNDQYDSARVWLQKTYDIAVAQGDTTWQGIAMGNTGSVYYLQQQYQEAIARYEKALSLCRITQTWDNIASFCCQLADCYLQTGNTGSIIKVLLAEADSANAKAYIRPGLIKYFAVTSDYYRKTGNTKLALQYTDSLRLYQKQQTEAFDINKKIKAEAQLAYRNQVLENEIAQQKIKRERWIVTGLAIMLVLLCIIGILLYKRQRLQYKLMQVKLEHEQYKTREELQTAMMSIREFTNLVHEKNELIQQFTAEIELLKRQNKSITDDQLIQLEQLRQSAILTEDDWNNFKDLFGKVHPGFLPSLKLKYPDLTPAETRYLVFTKLQLNNRKMSAMLGVSAEAIRNIRFRVKKKLGLDDGDEIERLVNGL